MRKKQHKDIFESGTLLGQDGLAGSQLMENNMPILSLYAQNALLSVRSLRNV